MTDADASALLHGCGLPQAWRQQESWRILDSRFDSGLEFLRTWCCWRQDAQRPRLLHYVALTAAPVREEDLRAIAAPFPELLPLVDELAAQCLGLSAGFQRFMLDRDRVLLTLCVGDTMAMLRAQQFFADSVYLATDGSERTPVSAWNVWTVKALARCCRRDTALAMADGAPGLVADLTQCGFEFQGNQTIRPNNQDQAAPSGILSTRFNPRWQLRNTRKSRPVKPVPVGSCAVVGAGLAGASVAAALARRGWQVQVLDQADAPAAGASGLPVGLVAPHVSADDSPLSRLSRCGVRLMLQQARGLLQQGTDWDATGILERRVDGSPGLPDIWHQQAAWLKPTRLVRAWLAQPGVTFQGNSRVAGMRRHEAGWDLLDAQGQQLARADRVVFANATNAMPLIESLQAALPSLGLRASQLPAMQGLRGLLSWALHDGTPDAAFPAFPVKGAGSVVPRVPVDGDCGPGLAWFVGSSYQPDGEVPRPDEQNHAVNLARLRQLLPQLGQALAPQFESGKVHAWKNIRCVTADRLPAVGPLSSADNASLWICAGMGSRGLSFSVLCAELLAARWGAEPLPIEAGLARSLEALRGAGGRLAA